MIVTNEIDYEWDVDNQFVCAGFTDRNKKSVKAMETSDKIIYYVTKHSKFMASVEVSGVYFYSEEPVWMTWNSSKIKQSGDHKYKAVLEN